MILRNFDTELDVQGVVRMVSEPDKESMGEAISQKATSSRARSYLVREEWDWRDLRDYVVGQIEAHHGVFPRDAIKEASIFKRFVKEWGQQARDIAEFAFENNEGWWAGAPIGVNRFCQASDEYFAQPIAERLDTMTRQK